MRKLILLLGVLLLFFAVAMNRDYLIREHMTPTVDSLNKDITETNKKLGELKDDYEDFKAKSKAGSDQATLAMASLKSIKTS
jgi:hypothetical protein